MNEESKSVRNFATMSKEEFSKVLEKEENRTNKETFEDKALEKFIREPKESSLSVKQNLKRGNVKSFILFIIILIESLVFGIRGSMESYVAFPIAILCLIGCVITLKAVYDENNR